ncbi:MAG: hypothetical protein K2X45_13215 [Phreatobacter sp.]|nr:hypothetical protein [Phreatobacter sp.]
MLAGAKRMAATVWAYFDGTTPRSAIAASVAFIVVSNQPFYPFYLYLLLGGRAWPALLTWLSAPLFAAVPRVARTDEARGGALLVTAGMANTTLCTVAMGPASGVELFYLPCLALALLLFTGRQRAMAAAATVFATGAAMAAVRLAGAEGLVPITAHELASLRRINAFSVCGLLAVMAYLSRRLWWRAAPVTPTDGR